MSRSVKGLMVSLCGVILLSTPAIAQAVADQAAAPAPENAPTETAPQTPPLTPPVAENDNAPAGEQAVAPPNLGQGTKAEAEHSAEATAHKSLNDPNNQLGTSLSGRTKPIVEANGSQTNPAPAFPPPATNAE